MSKLTPAKPEEVMVIRNLTPDLVTLSVPFSRFGLARVGGRATIIRLKSQDLVVFSPVALTPDVKSTIESLGGKVKFLVAPDIEHHIFLSAWKQAYPDAQIIAPDGLKEKREQNPETRGLKFAHILTPTNKHGYKIPEFGDEMEIEYVDAHPNQEIVLFHKPTKTMVEADFIFNLPATEQFSKSEESPTQGLVTKLFVALMSAKGSVTWQKRTIWYLFASKDRKGYAQSANSMAKWDFDRIIPCHGDVIETGGKETFTNLLEWFLDGDKKRV
ncbi:hypothetical protein AJ80_09917 [Polytolypa hystricis UAMH7299]|uniref:Metallo-beta-lactamase domain-containing protein n=1 Tax=Polytolypa hystricis (strain UAMH7299) TaxID=1447883 RepID=A0A2B7WGG1_POLH7|nr:hypothetical protein AJ80_09917 [Polytolypa hystricis UAMH7299]